MQIYIFFALLSKKVKFVGTNRKSMEQLKYDVFISYSTKDYIDESKNVIPNNVISQIKTALREAGISYWFDEEGIYSGDEFAPVLARAIKDSELFLFVSSANSNQSEWTSSEIATAHAYGKKIVPFKIDDSVYHESVIMYVARLNSIDYYLNPSKAVGRLVESIQDYMTVKREERERIMKERQEQEELRRLRYEREQKDLAKSIELGASDLDADEAKVDIMRRRLQANVEKVDNPETRDRLSSLIEESGPIYRRQKEERRRLGETIDELKCETACLQKTIATMRDEVEQQAVSRATQTKERIYEFLRDYKLWCAGGVILILCVVMAIVGASRGEMRRKLSSKSQELAELSYEKKLVDEEKKQIIEFLDNMSLSRFYSFGVRLKWDDELCIERHLSTRRIHKAEDLLIVIKNKGGADKTYTLPVDETKIEFYLGQGSYEVKIYGASDHVLLYSAKIESDIMIPDTLSLHDVYKQKVAR